MQIHVPRGWWPHRHLSERLEPNNRAFVLLPYLANVVDKWLWGYRNRMEHHNPPSQDWGRTATSPRPNPRRVQIHPGGLVRLHRWDKIVEERSFLSERQLRNRRQHGVNHRDPNRQKYPWLQNLPIIETKINRKLRPRSIGYKIIS